jgi:hypothetical protein
MLLPSRYIIELERVWRRNWVTTGFIAGVASNRGGYEAIAYEAMVRSFQNYGVEIIDTSTDEGRAAETLLLLADQGDE